MSEYVEEDGIIRDSKLDGELIEENRKLAAALRVAILCQVKTTSVVVDCDPAAGSTYEVDWTSQVREWAELCGLDLSKHEPFFYQRM